MNWQLIVRPEARAELSNAIDWYQMQRPGLGDRFLESFLASVNGLLEKPFRFQRVDEDIRRVRLRSFPYSILYFVEGDSIVVVACAHASRRPGYWRTP